jgi:hypothetical protein
MHLQIFHCAVYLCKQPNNKCFFYPSVRDGVFRQFNGERSLNGLKKYIEFQEWERTEPISSYFGPNSILYVD